MDKVPVEGRKMVWTIVIIVSMLIVLGLIGYHYIIPRVRLDVKVIYHEGMLLGETNLHVCLTNSGTKDVKNVCLIVNVSETNGKGLENSTSYFPSIPTDEKESLHMNFSGDRNIRHIISVVLSFSSGGNDYHRKWNLREDGKYMNVAFERSVIDWFP